MYKNIIWYWPERQSHKYSG